MKTNKKNNAFTQVSTKNIEEKLSIPDVSAFPKMIKENIQSWIDLFNKIPGVKAYVFESMSNPPTNPDRIIDIRIVGSLEALMDSSIPNEEVTEIGKVGQEPHSWFALLIDGKFENYIDETEYGDSIYHNWSKELLSSGENTWYNLYCWMLKLIERYKTVTASQPEH